MNAMSNVRDHSRSLWKADMILDNILESTTFWCRTLQWSNFAFWEEQAFNNGKMTLEEKTITEASLFWLAFS